MQINKKDLKYKNNIICKINKKYNKIFSIQEII